MLMNWSPVVINQVLNYFPAQQTKLSRKQFRNFPDKHRGFQGQTPICVTGFEITTETIGAASREVDPKNWTGT